MQIAILADVHLHDVHTGYGMVAPGSGAIALRTFSDTMGSTRVFNESHPALVAALTDIDRRGISHVVLLGDYSDDGQVGAVTALQAVLAPWRQKGMEFFATFGNHDCYGPVTRHQSKVLTDQTGQPVITVTSDPAASAPAMIQPGMRGMSTAEAMLAMRDYGLMRPANALHWETPFGTSDAIEIRHPAGSDASALDASYLVEPVPGLWLLMIDANVFVEHHGEWVLQADKAWDHVIAHRPYMLGWMADVARRAEAEGKTLLTFSHYPAIALTLAGKRGAEQPVGPARWSARMPSMASARALAATGIKLHFSGHMHVSGRSEIKGLVNIAVPSTVAFPGGYEVVDIVDSVVTTETVALADVPGFDLAFSAYAAQIAPAAENPVLATGTYTDFLFAHLAEIVRNVYLVEQAGISRSLLDTPFADFLAPALQTGWGDITVWHVVLDYYTVLFGGDLGLLQVSPHRQALYAALARHSGDPLQRHEPVPAAIEQLVGLLVTSLLVRDRGL